MYICYLYISSALISLIIFEVDFTSGNSYFSSGTVSGNSGVPVSTVVVSMI
jgi:hypothetical protein